MSGNLTDSYLGASSRQTPSLYVQSSSWWQPRNPVHKLQHALFGPKMTRPHPKEHLSGGRGRERGQEIGQRRPRETRVGRTRVSAVLAPIGTAACTVSTKCASSAAFAPHIASSSSASLGDAARAEAKPRTFMSPPTAGHAAATELLASPSWLHVAAREYEDGVLPPP